MKHQKTSLEAFRSLTDRNTVYLKIINALKQMKAGGTFEEISRKAKLDPSKVWKRLPELVEMKVVFNTGLTRPTSSGRKAMVRNLTKQYLKAS